ncbi:MAG: hypothetical protein EOM68_29505, partial [Spirochaetia bacterium]|nr:hypothetical protein [Spirochaetia bacterium]
MRCVIRRSVFETNSSSLHALCVSKDATDVPSGRKCIRFGTGEYDKCWDILRTPSEKADYLFTMICMGDDAIREKRKGAVRKILGDVGMECKFKDPKEFKDESGCIYYK